MTIATKPRLLDLCCRAGGAGKGYADAGFDVVGVDIDPQPNYPFAFVQADALKLDARFLAFFDAVHTSPPCQAHSKAQRLQGNHHADMIPWMRKLLRSADRPYVIENVEGSPLENPVMLCGSMFSGLRTYRHRLFECSFPAVAPEHGPHLSPMTKMGRPPRPGDFMHVVGNFSGVQQGRAAMGIDWMNRDELREAIPPAYTEFLGRQLMAEVMSRRLALAA